MTPKRRGSALMEFPNELDVLITREFDAPIGLVFDVLTKPEHVSNSFVTEDGTVCAFRGTYLEVEPPTRTVETCLFGGWPDAEAVETWQLRETGAVTTVTMRLEFRDKAGRDHYPASGPEARELTSSDGPGASFDAIEEILRSLLDPPGAVSE